MCGLNGIFAYGTSAEQPSREELILSRDHMSRRGPDGFGEWWDPTKRIGLGHRRLAILDLSDLGHQPMQDDAGNVIVFNGEIYNFQELRANLERSGFQFQSGSDTEVLLKAYKFYGQDFLKHLRGMFAIAIWDKEKQSILLARDPFGIKPLYIHDDGNTLRFSSQVRSILAGRAVPPDIDPAGIVGFYLLGSVPEPFTIIRHIRCVPAGHLVWCKPDEGVGNAVPFCLIEDELTALEQEVVEDSEFRNSVGEAVRDSVNAHFIADVDVGLFLSAGVDSGALLGATRASLSKELQAVTLGFESFANTPDDEVPWATKLATFYDAKHHVVRITQSDFDRDLRDIFDAMDQPSIDGLNTWFVAKAAKEAGLKVAISGLGGDELLAGYPGFQTIPKLHAVGKIIKNVPFGPFITRAILRMTSLAKKKPKMMGLPCFGATFDGAHLLYRSLYLPGELHEFLDPAIVREGLEMLQEHWVVTREIRSTPSSANSKISALECNSYTRAQLLRDADWAGMAHSIEIRTPLLDIEVLRAVAPFLPRVKNRDGKIALASASEPPLPDELVNRPKSGFTVPTARWMNDAANIEEPSLDGGSVTKGRASRQWAQHVIQQYGQSLTRSIL